MASNDRKKPNTGLNSESGRRTGAPGTNDSSDTFTDMPSATPDPDMARHNAGEKPNEDHKVDISSADDVDVDKDIPAHDADAINTPPGPIRDGG